MWLQIAFNSQLSPKHVCQTSSIQKLIQSSSTNVVVQSIQFSRSLRFALYFLIISAASLRLCHSLTYSGVRSVYVLLSFFGYFLSQLYYQIALFRVKMSLQYAHPATKQSGLCFIFYFLALVGFNILSSLLSINSKSVSI